jgi:hypothetical protein
MRAALIVVVLCAAGCGSTQHAVTTQPVTTVTRSTEPAALRIGVVGPLAIAASGAVAVHGDLATMPGYPLVLVSASVASAAAVAAAADAHPDAHYALVGASTKDDRRPNLAGLVLADDQAALLGGFVAGLVAAEQGPDARVAWVGPQETALAAAFGRGTHAANATVPVLHGFSKDVAARCKEAALGVIARGAVAVMAHQGECADAAVAGAHEQNRVGLQLSDFELPDVAAGLAARDAVDGLFHGGEDVIYGASSGAIGVRALDPRIPSAAAVRARAAAQQLANGLPPSG